MAYKKRQPEPEEEAGAPEWMVTFSDCMTLLLTFFVLLLSFSSFDENTLRRLTKTFTKQLPSVSLVKRDKSAFITPNVIESAGDLDRGSEKPTLAKDTKENLTKESEPKDFHEQRVFLIPSELIFWGNGTVISFRGRKTLSDMAAFLKEVPNKVVVSENGGGDEKFHGPLGLQRSWAVIKYLKAKQELDKGQFSIAADTLQKNHEEELKDNSQVIAKRTLEIVLLERSICN